MGAEISPVSLGRFPIDAGLLLRRSASSASPAFDGRIAGAASGRESDDRIIANGAGTTMIHGGTGPSGGFVPVLTTVAFHAER